VKVKRGPVYEKERDITWASKGGENVPMDRRTMGVSTTKEGLNIVKPDGTGAKKS